MGKMIENLKWRPRWVSHLGCIAGCLEYLGVDVSDAWLYGATGHAFVLNVHEEVCPSGPTAWKAEILFRLAPNLGYTVDGVFALKSQSDFAELQRRAWRTARDAIDQGLPCYGWELEIPEYYVVYGYDEAGYYFRGPGCDEGKGPKAWQELGDTGIGALEMYVVRPGQPAEDAGAVKAALSFALEYAKNPGKWTHPNYKAGLAGYDTWIHALETETADGFGMAFNAAVWSECRGHAFKFLKEAKERVGDEARALFDQAIGHYQVVAENLETVADAYPFHGLDPAHIEDKDRRRTAIDSLRAARTAEEAGLGTLERILAAL